MQKILPENFHFLVVCSPRMWKWFHRQHNNNWSFSVLSVNLKELSLHGRFFLPVEWLSWHSLSLSIRRGRFSRVNWVASSDHCVRSIMRMNGHVIWCANMSFPDNNEVMETLFFFIDIYRMLKQQLNTDVVACGLFSRNWRCIHFMN